MKRVKKTPPIKINTQKKGEKLQGKQFKNNNIYK